MSIVVAAEPIEATVTVIDIAVDVEVAVDTYSAISDKLYEAA